MIKHLLFLSFLLLVSVHYISTLGLPELKPIEVITPKFDLENDTEVSILSVDETDSIEFNITKNETVVDSEINGEISGRNIGSLLGSLTGVGNNALGQFSGGINGGLARGLLSQLLNLQLALSLLNIILQGIFGGLYNGGLLSGDGVLGLLGPLGPLGGQEGGVLGGLFNGGLLGSLDGQGDVLGGLLNGGLLGSLGGQGGGIFPRSKVENDSFENITLEQILNVENITDLSPNTEITSRKLPILLGKLFLKGISRWLPQLVRKINQNRRRRLKNRDKIRGRQLSSDPALGNLLSNLPLRGLPIENSLLPLLLPSLPAGLTGGGLLSGELLGGGLLGGGLLGGGLLSGGLLGDGLLRDGSLGGCRGNLLGCKSSGGILGGLTRGSGLLGGPQLGSLTGGGGPLGSPIGASRLLGGPTGGSGPLEDLTGGERPLGDLTGGERPLEGLTGGERPLGDLTGGERPLGDLTGGERPLGDLTGGERPLGDLTARKTPPDGLLNELPIGGFLGGSPPETIGHLSRIDFNDTDLPDIANFNETTESVGFRQLFIDQDEIIFNLLSKLRLSIRDSYRILDFRRGIDITPGITSGWSNFRRLGKIIKTEDQFGRTIYAFNIVFPRISVQYRIKLMRGILGGLLSQLITPLSTVSEPVLQGSLLNLRTLLIIRPKTGVNVDLLDCAMIGNPEPIVSILAENPVIIPTWMKGLVRTKVTTSIRTTLNIKILIALQEAIRKGDILN